MLVTNDVLARRRSAAGSFWPNRTLLDHLARGVAAAPDKVAVVATRSETGAVRRISYRDLDHMSGAVAGALAARGVGHGDVVSFQLPNWWEFTVLHLACLKLGAVSNPLMVIFRGARTHLHARACPFEGPSRACLVPGLRLSRMVAGIRSDLPDLAHVFVAGGTERRRLRPASRRRAAAACGPVPRRCDPAPLHLRHDRRAQGRDAHIQHHALSNLGPFAERLGLSADAVIHMPSPMAPQLGFMYGLVLPVMLGATAVLQDIFVAEEMARQIISERATFTMGATPFLNDLTEHVAASGIGTPSLRIFVSAGAPIPRRSSPKPGRRWELPSFLPGACPRTGRSPPPGRGSEEKTTMTDGVALPGMEVRVLDASGAVAPPARRGNCRCVAAPISSAI